MFEGLVSGMNNICLGVFKTSKTVIFVRNGVEKSIDGIFDCNYLSSDPESRAEIMSNNPVLGVKISEIGTTDEADRIIIDGKPYRIMDEQPDSGEMVKLYLRRVNP